jgi:hypothetical protein
MALGVIQPPHWPKEPPLFIYLFFLVVYIFFNILIFFLIFKFNFLKTEFYYFFNEKYGMRQGYYKNVIKSGIFSTLW